MCSMTQKIENNVTVRQTQVFFQLSAARLSPHISCFESKRALLSYTNILGETSNTSQHFDDVKRKVWIATVTAELQKKTKAMPCFCNNKKVGDKKTPQVVTYISTFNKNVFSFLLVLQ